MAKSSRPGGRRKERIGEDTVRGRHEDRAGAGVKARQYYEQSLKLFSEIGSPSAESVQANLDALDEEE